MGDAGGSRTTQTQQLGPTNQRMNDLRLDAAVEARQAAGWDTGRYAQTPEWLYMPSGLENTFLNQIQERTWQQGANPYESQAMINMDQALWNARGGATIANENATQRADSLGGTMSGLYGASQQQLAQMAPALWASQGAQNQALGQAQQNIAGMNQQVQNQLGQYDVNQGYGNALDYLGWGGQQLGGFGQQANAFNQFGMNQFTGGQQYLAQLLGNTIAGAGAQTGNIIGQQGGILQYGNQGAENIAQNLRGLEQMGGTWGNAIGQNAMNLAGYGAADQYASDLAAQGAGAGQQDWLNQQLGNYGAWGGQRLSELSGQLGGNLQQNTPEAQAWAYLNQAGGPGQSQNIMNSLLGLQQMGIAGSQSIGQQAAQYGAGWNNADTTGNDWLSQAMGPGYTPQIMAQQQQQLQQAQQQGAGVVQGLQAGMNQNAMDITGLGGLDQAMQAGLTPQILQQLQQAQQQAQQTGAGITQGLQGQMGQNAFETMGQAGLTEAMQAGLTPEIRAMIRQQQQQAQAGQTAIGNQLQQGQQQNAFETGGLGSLQAAQQAGYTPEIMAQINAQRQQALQQQQGISQGIQGAMGQTGYEQFGMQNLEAATGAGMTPQIQQALAALTQRGDQGSLAIRDRLIQALGPNAMEASGNQAFTGAGGDLGMAGINQTVANQLAQGTAAGQGIAGQIQAGQALTPQEQAAQAQLQQAYADQGMTGINQQLAQMNLQSGQQAQQIRDRLQANMGLTGFEQWGQEQFNRATNPDQQLAAARGYLENVVGGELANRLQQGGLGGVRSGAYGEDLARAGADLILPILQQTQQLQGQAGAAGLQAGAGLRQAGVQTGGIEQGLLGQLQQGGLGAAQVGAGMLGDVRAAQTAAGQAGLASEAQRRAAGVQGAGVQAGILGQLLQTGLGGQQLAGQMSEAQRQALTSQGQAQLAAGAQQRAAGVQAGGIEANMLDTLQRTGLGGQQLMGELERARQATQLGAGQAGLQAGEAYRQAGLAGAGINANMLGQLIQQGTAGTGQMSDLERARQATALGAGQAQLQAGEAQRQAGVQGAGIQAGLLGQLLQTGATGTNAMTDLERARQATALGVGQTGMQAGEALRQAGLQGAGIQRDLLGQLMQQGTAGAGIQSDLERARQATALGVGQAGLQAGDWLRQAGIAGAGVQSNLIGQLLQGSGAAAGTAADLERARQATQLGAGQAQYQQAQNLRESALGAGRLQADMLGQLLQTGTQGQQIASQMDIAQRQAQLGIGQAGLQQGEALRRAGLDTGALNAQMMQDYMQFGLGSTGLSADMANQQRQAQMQQAALAQQRAQDIRGGGLQAAGLQGDLLNQLLQTGTAGQQINAGLLGQNLQAGLGATGQQADMMQALLGAGVQGAGMQADFNQTMTNNLMNQALQARQMEAGLTGQMLGTAADIYGTRAGAGQAGLNALANIYGTNVGAQTALSGQALGAQSDWQRALNQYAGMGLESQGQFINQLGQQQGRYLDYGLGQQEANLGLLQAANQQGAMGLELGGALDQRNMENLQAAYQAAGISTGRVPQYEAWGRDADTLYTLLTGLPVSTSGRTTQKTANERDWLDFALNSVGTIAGAAAGAMT